MTRFRINTAALLGLAVMVFALSVQAQAPASSAMDAGKDGGLPSPAFGDVPPDASAPLNITPSSLAPASPITVTPPAVPVAPPSSVTVPVLALPPSQPVDLGKPVEATKLGDINPESVGLLSVSDGGLGAGMWKGTSRHLVENLLPALNLPSFSPTINNLAQRFLLTTADIPAGKSGNGLGFIALRVNELIALGDVKDAEKLLALAKPEQIDDNTLHKVLEAALVNGESADICARLPEIIKSRSKTDWQEMLLVCQLIARDTKAAQLTLDLMHTQGVKNDNLFFVAEHNIIGGAKELPRQLAPLKPSLVALLQVADIPVRGDVYAHPDVTLIPALLRLKTKEDNARLTLAESAAERGIITPADLEGVYGGIVFAPELVANAINSAEAGARLHALLYQAAVQEKAPEKRVALSVKFLQNATAAAMNGAQAHVLGDMIGSVSAAEDYNVLSASVARIYLMAGNKQAAAEWLKQAQHAATLMPAVAAELQDLWPLTVLGGLEADGDYGQNLGKWLDAALRTSDPKNDDHNQRERAGSILLLLDAAGFAVPEEDWIKVLGVPVSEKHTVPSALFLERLQAASAANKRGETVLFSLLLEGNVEEPSFISTLSVIRALRVTGLTADASLLARETAAAMFAPSGKP